MTKVQFLKLVSLVIVVVVTVIGSNVVSAQDVSPLGVEWQCVQQYDEYYHILCIPRPTGDSVAPKTRGDIVKASLPGGGNLRADAERGLTEVLSAEARSVPMFAQPKDKVMVGLLLETVLCDSAPRCSVSYRGN